MLEQPDLPTWLRTADAIARRYRNHRDDVRQVVLLELWDRWQRGDVSLEWDKPPHLMRVGDQAAKRWVNDWNGRRRGDAPRVVFGPMPGESAMADPADLENDSIAAMVAIGEVAQLLEQATPRQRQWIEHVLDDWTDAEIAARFRVKRGAVRELRSQLRARLRRARQTGS